MNTRRFEPVVQLDSGLIIPKNNLPGYALVTDWAGNAAWQDKTPPNIQPGFLGVVGGGNIIQATLPGTTSLTPTFTGYPGADAAYWNNVINGASGLIKGFLPASLPALPLTSFPVSGNFLYVALVAQAPVVAEGGTTPSLSWLHTSATSRSTAALAAADQFTFQPAESPTYGTLSYSLILWDGIVWNNGGNYSFVAGTPASGSPIPALGRDRRLWANGYNNYAVGNALSVASGTSTNAWAAMTSNLQLRVECSGAPMEFDLDAFIYGSSGSGIYGYIGLMADSAPFGYYYQIAPGSTGGNGPNQHFKWRWSPGTGSHLISPAWFPVNGQLTLGGAWCEFAVLERAIASLSTNGTA